MALTISEDNIPEVGDVVQSVKKSDDGDAIWVVVSGSGGEHTLVCSVKDSGSKPPATKASGPGRSAQ